MLMRGNPEILKPGPNRTLIRLFRHVALPEADDMDFDKKTLTVVE
jgi:hypothetical protein